MPVNQPGSGRVVPAEAVAPPRSASETFLSPNERVALAIRAGAAGLLAIFLLGLGPACARRAGTPKVERPKPAASKPEPPAPALALVGATVWTADAAGIIERGTVFLESGRIRAVGGPDLVVPAGVRRIDVSGRFVTPGLIDAHSHLGVYPSPSVDAHADGNEATDPVTADVAARHSFWPQDPGLSHAAAAGVTTLLVLPGSANLIGGRGFTVKNRPARSAAAMRFAEAPSVLKMACGENPKRVYGKKSGPSTRMGNLARVREAFLEAADYRRKRDNWEKKGKAKGDLEPLRDLELETLADVLAGKVLVQNHCYRADEMLQMLEVAQELGFQIRAFHHALEAYKIADVLAARQVAAATWSDWWGFKMEAWDGIPQNLAMVHAAGARAIVHSDSGIGIQRLNQAAAQGLAVGREMGLGLTEEDALRWITVNPAWALGIDEKTGSLAAGKMADVVVWNRPPLSVYARPDLVFVDGHLVFDRAAGRRPSDFEVGLLPDAAAPKPAGVPAPAGAPNPPPSEAP